MKKARPYCLWVLCAAAALAGCGSQNQKWDWDWWKKPKEPPKTTVHSPATDPNLEVKPAEALRLKDENKTLRDQLQELQVRDQQLADQLKQTKILYEGQVNMIDALKDAPGERDKYKKQVEDLKAENDRLRQEITRLKTGEAPAASQPASVAPAPVVSVEVVPPVRLVPATVPTTAPSTSPVPGFD
jgi:cell division protein FtsB